MPSSPLGMQGEESRPLHDLGNLSLKQNPSARTRTRQSSSTIMMSAIAMGADADMFVFESDVDEEATDAVELSTHGSIPDA